MPATGLRTCRKCSEQKPIEQFSKDARSLLGYSHTCLKCKAAASLAQWNSEPGKHKAKNLRRYQMTLEQWEQLLESQNGCCAVCLRSGAELCVDHCHKTNKVRGLLCRKCNAALGQMEDDPDRMARAIKYLAQ